MYPHSKCLAPPAIEWMRLVLDYHGTDMCLLWSYHLHGDKGHHYGLTEENHLARGEEELSY